MKKLLLILLLGGVAALILTQQHGATCPLCRPEMMPPAGDTAPGTGSAARWQASWADLDRRLHAAASEAALDAQVLRPAFLAAVTQLQMDANALIAAGDRANARVDFLTAVQCFRRARELDPNNLDAAKGLGIALTASGHHDQAAQVYRDLLAAEPNDPTSAYNLATCCARLGQPGEAQALYERITREHPAFHQAWYNLATLYQTQGKLQDAARAWREVISLQPRLAHPHAMLGEAMMDLDDPNAAMIEFAEAAGLEPDNAVNYLNLATAAAKAGNYGTAAVAVKRAADLEPKDPLLWSALGELQADLYRSTGKDAIRLDAIRSLERSLAIDGDQKDARTLLEELRKK